MVEEKEIAIQVLNEPDALPEDHFEQEQQLVMVKLWNPDTWEVSEVTELFVSRQATLHEFAGVLSAYFPFVPRSTM